jgi:hypothetical protein
MSRQHFFLISPMKNLINESKLLSKRNCFSILFYNIRFVKLNLHESAYLVIDECLIFWRKTRIPTQYTSDCLSK